MTRPCGPHDIGGAHAGPIDPSEHDTAWWEWQVDAMVRLAMAKGLFTDFAELRDGIERLAPEDYERLTYYERWAISLAHALLDKGVVTQGQLNARIAEIRKRHATAGEPP
ncbi:MAG: ScnB-like protein [Pseudomonadota bacterium]